MNIPEWFKRVDFRAAMNAAVISTSGFMGRCGLTGRTAPETFEGLTPVVVYTKSGPWTGVR
ncbi:hypothetical protein SAMN05444714_1639 [Yoonia litorea]|uniref:Uncharacterized protein n=1 Tax=Yoonia litorea TaxID=1123755 RepID=A0A1I6ME98_9RHOB|nr:hypothetical protein SAMN05444714_1639 [Yoonia litorea]